MPFLCAGSPAVNETIEARHHTVDAVGIVTGQGQSRKPVSTLIRGRAATLSVVTSQFVVRPDFTTKADSFFYPPGANDLQAFIADWTCGEFGFPGKRMPTPPLLSTGSGVLGRP